MKNSILIILPLVLFSIPFQAQNEITLKTPYTLKPKYFKLGDQPYQKIGSLGKNLGPYLKEDEEAYKEFIEYKSSATSASFMGVVCVIGGGMGAAGIMQYLVNGVKWDLSGRKEYQESMKKGEILMIVGLGLDIVGFIGYIAYKSKANRKLKHSILIYNQNLPENPQTFFQKIKPDKLGLSPVYSGNGFQIGLSWTIE